MFKKKKKDGKKRMVEEETRLWVAIEGETAVGDGTRRTE